MSLKPLIKGQTIRIDDHMQDGKVEHIWDDVRDIHLDKWTNNGRHDVRIKISLNGKDKITIKNNKRPVDDIPATLRKEIKKAFKDKKTRENFFKDVIYIVKQFGANIGDMETEEQRELAKNIIGRIAKYFGGSEVYADEYIQHQYIQLRKDKYKQLFFYQLSSQELRIGEIDKYLISNANPNVLMHLFPLALPAQHL
mgnify:CR=1 FL=1